MKQRDFNLLISENATNQIKYQIMGTANGTSKQWKDVAKIIELIQAALFDLTNELKLENESTMKHYFFYHLLKRNPNHYIIAEDKYKKNISIKKEWEADFVLYEKNKKVKANNAKTVAIEFKINSYNEKQIKNDFDKLAKLKKSNPKLNTFFINYFTEELNFKKYHKLTKIFDQNLVYSLTICKNGVNNFTYEEGIEIKKLTLNEFTVIVNYTDMKASHFYKFVKRSNEITVPGKHKGLSIYADVIDRQKKDMYRYFYFSHLKQ